MVHNLMGIIGEKTTKQARLHLIFNNFMNIFYFLIHNIDPPLRVFPEFKGLLQLSLDPKVGDWYIFVSHAIMRIYGFEEESYMMPTFITPRSFALEYIRQTFVSDQLHFAKHKHSITFKPPKEVVPFLVKFRDARLIVEDMLP